LYIKHTNRVNRGRNSIETIHEITKEGTDGNRKKVRDREG
jgi:hypothetical protein